MYHKNKNKNNALWSKINGFLIVFIVIIFVGSIALASQSGGRQYMLSKLVTETRQLRTENQTHSAIVADLQSVTRLDVERKRLNLVTMDRIVYLAPKGSVAINK